MSSHKHNFQCFNAIGGNGSHKSSPPFKHHTPHLPRIPQHGSMVHTDECCLCTEYRQAQALEAEETQLSDFHQTHPLYHKYHPHQYVLRAPGRPEEGQECHIQHHRHNKRVVLVKSSDPSIKKTIILHRRSLRSIGLFLEEISELMHFNIRKLYTPDGQRIDSIQSLLQCPGVLVCVGREPSHPSVKEHFSTDKLPKLGVKSRFTDTADGHERPGAEKSVIPPKAESENKGTKRSHERPVPDSADSPDLVGSYPPTDNNMKDDDIKKRVRINKDGSLSMEMKVRFRLHNNETLHWSTKVRKTSGGTCEFKQGHSNAYYAQVSDRSFSESETFSAEEACVTRPYRRHAEEPHCPLCSSHFQDYDIWENVPDTHGARRCAHSSSSSASSHTVVSRKTIVKTESVSRSSEELTEQVIEKETCIKKIIQAAETVEYCTVCDEREGGSQRASRASQKSNLEVEKKASSPSGGSDKSNNSKLYQICQCGASPGHVNERNEQIMNQDEDEEDESGILSSAMSVKSHASNTSDNAACRDNQGRRSKSAMSCYSDASTKSTCGVLEGQQTAEVKVTQERTLEYLKPEEDGKEDRASSSVSSKVSTKSKGSRISSVRSEKPADEDLELRTPSTMSAISNVSAELKHITCETSEEESSQSSTEEKESHQNAQIMISEKGGVSPRSETSEAAPTENTQDYQAAKQESERTQSVQSVESVGSNSSTSVQESTGFEATTVRTTSVLSVQSNASTKSAENEPKERPHSTQSVKSVVSNKSTKSERSKTAEIFGHKDDDAVENGDAGEPKEETEVEKMPNNTEERVPSGMSNSKVTQAQQSDSHEDNSEETLCDGETKRSLSSISATSTRSNCSAVAPTNENIEISLEENEVNTEDRGLSRVSVNSVQSHAERAPSALSSKSAKSHTSVKSNKSNTKTLNDKATEEETQERTQSGLSINSTEVDTATGEHTSECKEHVERTPSNMSVRSEKSDTSFLSQKSEVSEASMGNEVRTVEGEDVKRPLSVHSVVSDVSVRSNKSKRQHSREDVENIKESIEERPSSTRSSRSKQSCVSKMSEERPQSTLSAKSVKSEVLSVEDYTAGGQEDADESQERAESVRSAKSTKSAKSAKTSKSKERDEKENASDSDRESRSPSILSVKSAKSTMSKASTRSKKYNVSKSCLEGDVDSLDERNIKGGSGSETVRSVSVQSVDSSVSGKSKTQNSPADVPPDEESVISEQSSKEKADERTPSAMSAKSEESSLSEMSINSVETANSARSSKSARSRGSTKSIKSKASENCSGKTPEERGCENLEGTDGQDCPAAEEACDNDKPVSDLSGKSVTPNASTDVYEVCSEDGANNTDDKIVEGESEGRPLSAQSFDSNTSANKSNCTNDAPVGSDIISGEDTSKEPESERAASTVSTKSVQSNISGTSGSHGKKTSSALSAKSPKSSTSEESVHSKDSDPQSARASEIDTEDQERTGSAISVRSNHSEKSVQSERPERSDVESTTDCEEHTDRAQSNLSVKSGKSAKSNTTTVSKRSKVSEKVENTDGDNIEQSEERAPSCTSTKSVQSHVSESSRKSCADGSHEDSAQERTQSVLSAKSMKSTRSAKSNESKGMDDPSNGDIPHEKENRTLSSMSERSKSTESNVSAVSKKSEVSVSCELSEDATVKEQEEEDLGNRSVKSDTSVRSSRSKCGSDFPTKENSQPKSQSSAKSLRSNLSGSSIHSTPEERNDEESQDRAKSASSEKSTTSKKSKKSKVSVSPAEESATGSDDLERSASSLSVNSAKSGHFSEAKKSKASDQQSGYASEAADADNEGRMSSLSTLTNRSNISARSKLSKGSDTVTSQNLGSENIDVDEEKSCISVKSDQSHVSTKSKKNEAFAGDVSDEKEKTTEMAPSTLSARSTKSEKSTKSRELIVSDAPADDCASEKSIVSVHSHRSAETDLLEESAVEENTGEAPSCVLTGSEDSAERGQSVMSVTSNGSRKSSKNCKPSADSNEEQTVEEAGRSPSNMSGSTNKSNTYASSRNVTPHGGALEDFTNEGERSPSIVSEKSSTSVKSTQQGSTKSSRSKVSDSQRGEKLDEEKNRPLSKASMKSAKSNYSENCNEPQASPDQSVHAVDENKENASNRALSPISAKSNATSTTAKSNTSCNSERSRNLEGLELKSKEDENVKKTPSVLSVGSKASSKTMQSNRSGTSKKKTIGDEVDTDDIKDGVRSTKSAKSHQSEVPAVTVEESEDRSPTTMSLKSKASGHSKRSKSSEGQKSERKTKGSLSVHSHLSTKSKRSTVTDVSAATVTSSNPAEVVKITGKVDKMSDGPQQPLKVKNQLIRQSESKDSDLSQTLSSSEVIKETGEISSPLESKSLSEKDSSCRPKSKEGDESELVPSILPNTSPTEVVNEWLKTIPPESDIYEMEDLSENCEKISQAAEGGKEAEDIKKTDNSSTETSKDIDTGGEMNPDPNDEGKARTETPNDNKGSPPTDDPSKMLNSSVQVMRVLLNPKPDRCNSLPEISPVYGRKLSTSATGLLDCLVKLQLIDHNPKNANEQDKKYQDLMHILQSLWLCNPSQNEQTPTRNDNHFVEDEYNHTSSSGVDVNSGSTGSGKSSDGIKSSNSNHEDVSQLHSIPVCKDTNEDAVWQPEREEQKLEGDRPETNDAIRYNDSPRETPETPTSSNESSGTSSTTSQKLLQETEPKGEEDRDAESPVLSKGANLTKNMSHNPDPVWVLSLLTKIEKQFMVHYVRAMKEFKGRWNLADNDQLDEFINELKVEIERRIQKSINREVRKIQDSVGLPRPPNDTRSHDSTGQAKKRKQKLKKSLQHSAGSQEEKSDDSTTGTSYSDQRSENIDESCPCETCIKTSMNSEASLTVEATNTAHSGDEARVAVALVENIVVAAVKEVEREKVDRCTDNTSPYEEDEKEDESKSMESLTKHEGKNTPLVTEEDSTEDEREAAKTAKETTLEGETQDSDEDEASGDEDALKEAGAETAADEELATDGSQEEELTETEACVVKEPKLLKEASIATTAEEEEAEASTAASSEHESERDGVVEDFDETDRDAAVEARRVDDEEEDGGIEESAGDSNSTTNDDDTTDDATSHRLSSEAAEDATEDEVAAGNESEVTRDDEVCNVQTKDSAGEDETVKETNMLAASEHGSVTENQSEEGLQSDREVTSEDDSPHENQDLATANDLIKEQDDIEMIEGDTSEDKHSTGDDAKEEEVRASSDHGSESEEPVEMEKVHEEEESSAASESNSAEDLDATSDAISSEDEGAEETAGSVSKHDSEKDEDEEESSVIKQDKPSEISADEERNTSTAGESSSEEEEDPKMTDDDSAADKDDAATSRSESKDATDEDETNKDEETELNTQVMVEDTADDGNDTGVVSEDHSTEDETPKESDATCSELSSEQPEKNLEKTEEEPPTPETNSGAENDSEEDESDLANNETATDEDSTVINKEHDQGEDTANKESEGEEDHDENPVVGKVDITSEDAEEDTTSSQDDSEENEEASPKEETSGEEDINKVNSKSIDTSNEEVLDDCGVKDNPQSASEESSSEDESKEQSNNSGTDESRPGSSVTDPNDTTGQDESKATESEDDSEIEPKNPVVDEILEEASDENETSSKNEEQEETESSDKPADSSANELEEVTEREHGVLDEESGDVTKNESIDKSSVEDTRTGEETEVQTFTAEESALGQELNEDVRKPESKDCNSCDKEKNTDDALDKEEETETGNDDWSGDEGNSADEEDEAEEDEPEEHNQVELKPLAVNKATNQGQADRRGKKTGRGKETLLKPLDTLKKEKDESEDGAYADVEDSEAEINS